VVRKQCNIILSEEVDFGRWDGKHLFYESDWHIHVEEVLPYTTLELIIVPLVITAVDPL